MKKILKISLIVFFIIQCLFVITFLFFCLSTKNINLDDKKLINNDVKISIYDNKNNLVSVHGSDREIVEEIAIPQHVKNAFIAIEDKRFYKHNGIDIKGIVRATINNIKALSFKEGASSITQQLVKNTHLTSEKSLKRKFAEIKIAVQLERKYTKDEILGAYLNTIYFGEGCYGISKASSYYFNKKVEDLSLSEGACLAGIINAPHTYSIINNNQKSNERKNLVLMKMLEQSFINEEMYNNSIRETIPPDATKNNVKYDYFNLVKSQYDEIFNNRPFLTRNCSIYTNLDSQIQNDLFNSLNLCGDSYNKSAIAIDKDNNILAYCSNCKMTKRQLGSVLKPLAVYAPALELNAFNSCSIINDEKTDFNGYSPKNFDNKYYGKISFKNSLAKSLNVCSAKIMNSIGVEKSIEYLKKLNLDICESDKNLSLSLGATYNGIELYNIASAYNIFLNNGEFTAPSSIRKITNEYGKTIYKNNQKKSRVFSEDTTYIMNDILKETVISGTAKKLGYLNKNLCAKTGTVGSEAGNSDAYCISYNPDVLIGVWLGAKDNLMKNTLTGGSAPTSICSVFWEKYFEKNPDNNFNMPLSVEQKDIDLIAYNEEGIVILADKKTPKRYKRSELFRKSNIPTNISSRFVSPEIKNVETLVNNNGILIRLCLPQLVNARVYRYMSGNEILIFDTQKTGNTFLDKNVKPNEIYQYAVIPYIKHEDLEYVGKKILLDKIKMPTKNVGKDLWWDEIY